MRQEKERKAGFLATLSSKFSFNIFKEGATLPFFQGYTRVSYHDKERYFGHGRFLIAVS